MVNAETPLVSICCLAFNHEEFMRDVLDGFVMQQTSFPFEVVIHDDASSDQTASIIREYELRYPGLIKPLYQLENQWLKGKKGSAVHNFPRAKGKYIALCEGDDHWTDPLKLQRQVDFLDANPEYAMVAENGLIVNTITDSHKWFNVIDACDISIPAMLKRRQFPTASVMFRAKFLDDQFYSQKVSGDTALWCYLGLKGKIRYLPNVSSVYTRGNHGMVESTGKLKWAQLMEDWNKQIDAMLPLSFDRDIFNERNFEEYRVAFYASMKEKNRKNSFTAIKKCFQYQPLRAMRTLIALPFK
jgi:glycosyltransferase involved in cell wall biosynthesis